MRRARVATRPIGQTNIVAPTAKARTVVDPIKAAEDRLLRDFRGSSGNPVGPTVNNLQRLAGIASVETRVQQQVSTARAPKAESTALSQQVHALNEVVQNWTQILNEVTQSVFVVCATTVVDKVPYYLELPENKDALKAPTGHLALHSHITMMYPQFPRPDLLYMRFRQCDVHTGEVQQYYIPIANQSLSSSELTRYLGLDSTVGQYVDFFHNPGDENPFTTTSQE